MSKRTSKPAAAETPAAGAIQSPSAGAASAAPEAGVAPTPPADSGASGGIQSPPPGEGVTDPTPSTSSNDAAAVNATPATETAVAGAEGGDALTLQIASVHESAEALVADVRDLVELARCGSEGSARLAMDGLLAATGRLAAINVLAGVLSASIEVEAGDLEELEVRSRDGKPFRRAGFQFGDAYQLVKATADQAAAIRADRRGCQIKGEN